MPKQAEKILKYIHREKSLKTPFAIYLDLECLLNECLPKQSQKSYTVKKAIHERSAWAMFTSCSFDKKENKLDYYRGKDCFEKSC